MEKKDIKYWLWKTLYFGTVGYGGFATIGLIKEEFVERKKWLNDKEFSTSLATSSILPGPIGVKLVSYLGYYLFGTLGAIFSIIFYLIPSFLLMVILAFFYVKYPNSPFFNILSKSLFPLIIVFIINAIIKIFKKNLYIIILASIALILALIYRINTIYLLLFSGVVGIFLSKKFNSKKRADHNDEITLKIKNLDKTFFISIFVISIFYLILYIESKYLFSLSSDFLIMGFLGFGGGYALIPMMEDMIVHTRHYLDMHTFLDALVIGQVTPGPVAITSTFVGYVCKGLLGATVSTFGMFLSSFILSVIACNFSSKLSKNYLFFGFVNGVTGGLIGVLTAIAFRYSFKIHPSFVSVFIIILGFLFIIKYKKPHYAVIFSIALGMIFKI